MRVNEQEPAGSMSGRHTLGRRVIDAVRPPV